MDEKNGEYGSGFSVAVAKSWEASFFEHSIPNVRKAALRTAIVLGNEGGALTPIMHLTKFGLGGKQGTGNQKFSWIHEFDFARSIEFILKQPYLDGAINIVAPKPTTNKLLMKQLQKALKSPLALPLPKFLLEIGTKIIRTETELVLKSRNVIPQKLLDFGYKFAYPKLDIALQHLITKPYNNDQNKTSHTH